MQFIPKPRKGFVRVRFEKGDLARFTGKELVVGWGKTAPLDSARGKPLSRRKLIIFLRKIVSLAKQNRIKALDMDFKAIRALQQGSGQALKTGMTDFELGQLAGTAFVMADYEHVSYKQKPKEGFASVETIAVRNTPEIGKQGFWRGFIIGSEVNVCRELSNTPGQDMTPQTLAEAAKKAVKGTTATVKILDEKAMRKLGMGAILGVAQGASARPVFIVMEYKGAAKSQKPVVLIGKGVTFDTGGLNVKTGEHMYEMHMDMSGGAAVIHAVALAAKLKVAANVVGLIPAVENAVSGSSIRPGDILKSLSGKTIEVLNTDAEGRVVVADAITYAKRYDPALAVDVATLTGAALVALGVQASAYMTSPAKAEDFARIQNLGEKSGDYMWPFPAWEEYEAMTKGNFADVPNISTEGNSRYGGVIAGGMFLKRFYDDLKCPWLHIDMAPRMTAALNEFLAKGAAGAPVRFLLALIESYSK